MLIDIREQEVDIQCIQCDYVLDLNNASDITGIEYVDYCNFLDGASIRRIRQECEGKTFEKISLDTDSGAIYIKINDERSSDQLVVSGTMCKSSDGQIISVHVDYPPPEITK
ncbi:MAG: hypothetical protein Q8Q45_08630 [Methylococcaceae bacterium]|jgi:hypothetical protein|nr:hypothetical protein [Methylococcaceae bacterium]MDP3389240.1 hypothetical protein [Methylococcaceae bacterium]MDP3932403.1 hypothetical protein [Methylococcaceae bacterium]MDZ4098806.1 hypothetical protein [Methylophilaceae bacterium]